LTTYIKNVGSVISKGYAVTSTSTVDGSGTRTTTNIAIAADGSIASVTKSVTTATGGSVTTSFDNNGDGVYDRVQTKQTSTTAGVKTETITNRDGGGVLIDSTSTVTQTVAGVKTVTISRDESGGNYITQREVQTTAANGARTVAISDLNADGSVIRSETTGLDVTGLIRTVSTNMDNDAFNDRITTHTLTHVANVSSTETATVKANNNTVLGNTFDVMVINDRSASSQANDNQIPALRRVA
jgi:trimeric autotransporter adhesin